MAIPRRRLTLLDAMVLVAAFAVGVVAARTYFLHAWDSSSVSQLKMLINSMQAHIEISSLTQALPGVKPSSGLPSVSATQQQIADYRRRIDLERIFASYNLFLYILTVSLALLGLRRPRPRLRRLAHEAGWSACLTAIVVQAVRTIAAIAWWVVVDRARVARFPWPSCVAVFDDLELYVAPAIVAVWVVIALGGRGRLDWSSLGWLTLIAATSWVILMFKGAAMAVLAPL
jgi:hypothetical protein